jgi:LysM repeat protein
MKKIILFLLLSSLTVSSCLYAQDAYQEQVKKYINKYFNLAVDEQKRSGIPAAITLAQGIHESDAGTSELTTRGNNHFGIKCKSDWKGDTIIHTDNSPDECFKKYNSALESFRDHSDHLRKNPRYAALFNLSPTDYAAWAIGLHTSGYATNPLYSAKIIRIIEDYHLQEYTYMGMEHADPKNYPIPDVGANYPRIARKHLEGLAKDSLEDVVDSLNTLLALRTDSLNNLRRRNLQATSLKQMADSARTAALPKSKMPDASVPAGTNTDKLWDSGKTITKNGLKAFYAYKDEMLLKYAVKFKIRYAKLLELNDLPDAPLPDNMPVYLEKKLALGTHSRHTVLPGETMLQISQEEGLQLKKLYEFNQMKPGDEPAPGDLLELQLHASARPRLLPPRKKIYTAPTRELDAHKGSDDFVAVKHPSKDSTHNLAPQTKPEDDSEEDVVDMKKELDSVVYTDNSHLKPAHPQNLRDETPAPKPVKAAPPPDTPVAQAPPPVKEKPKKSKEKKTKTYVVKKGDTLNRIAEKFDVSVKELREWNHIKGNSIRDGQKLSIY